MTCVPRTHGPGPGAYCLPPLVGYPHHDPSRYRNPQYSMRPACSGAGRNIGPGPRYDIANMTRNGRVTTPAYSITSKKAALSGFNTPGPGTYSIGAKPANPAYTMTSRKPPLQKSQTPGPNQYNQPTSLGPKVPHLIAAPAYSFMGNNGMGMKSRSPGPATYAGVPTDNYLAKQPKFTIPGKLDAALRSCTPGPAAYLPRPPKQCSGGYSFGLRVCAPPYITGDDEIPCVEH